MLSRNGILKAITNGDIEIEPFDLKQLGPNSYDVRLGNTIAYYALVGNGIDYPTTTYGLVDQNMTPEVFGHQAALEPESPAANFIMNRPIMNLAGRPPIIQREISEDGIVLYPGNVYLALVKEVICGKRFVPQLTGRSSLARAGVGVEVSASYANLGDKLHYTVEITVTYPTIIYPNMKIAQVFFHQVEDNYDPELNQYTGKYSEDRFHDDGVIASYIPDPELEAHMYRLVQEQIRLKEEAERKAAEEANKSITFMPATDNPEPDETTDETTSETETSDVVMDEDWNPHNITKKDCGITPEVVDELLGSESTEAEADTEPVTEDLSFGGFDVLVEDETTTEE